MHAFEEIHPARTKKTNTRFSNKAQKDRSKVDSRGGGGGGGWQRGLDPRFYDCTRKEIRPSETKY